jgi:hypothetical protein
VLRRGSIIKKYEGISNKYLFVPFAVETLGPFGEEALALLKDLGKRLIEIESSGKPRSCAYLIQRGNAASILATVLTSSKFQEIFYL